MIPFKDNNEFFTAFTGLVIVLTIVACTARAILDYRRMKKAQELPPYRGLPKMEWLEKNMNKTVNFKMNLYLLTQSENRGYDTYDSMVVAAKSEDDARLMHPGDHVEKTWNVLRNSWCIIGYEGAVIESRDDWASPDKVKVQLIGNTDQYSEPQVVVASFNAG